MASPNWVRFKGGVGRRLCHLAGCLGLEPMVWRPAEASLRECSSLADMGAWRKSLPEELKGSPLDQYVGAALKRGSPLARLEISERDLGASMQEERSGVRTRALRGAVWEDAFSWGQEALYTWEGWEPGLNPEFYECVFDADWPLDRTENAAQEAVQGLVPAGRGEALALRYYDRCAMLIDFAELRSGWDVLLAGSDDYVVLPITPPVAAWAICYFHHDYLQVGRRIAEWPYRVKVSPAVRDQGVP